MHQECGGHVEYSYMIRAVMSDFCMVGQGHFFPCMKREGFCCAGCMVCNLRMGAPPYLMNNACLEGSECCQISMFGNGSRNLLVGGAKN